jgi:hypothetical protein
LAALLIVLCLAAVGGYFYYRNANRWPPNRMAAQLPAESSAILFVDVHALRQAGLLDLIAGSKSAEDLDYKQFIQETGFDYRSDLDQVAIAFAPDQRYVIANGRFDWKKLMAFAVSHGGACKNTYCEGPGPDVDQQVSFLPLRPTTLGLASGKTAGAAWRLIEAPRSSLNAPEAPVWVYVPGRALKGYADPPTGTRAFFSALAAADNTVFRIDPVNGSFQLAAEVRCANAAAAQKLRDEMTEATALLAKMLARDGQTPNPRDLSGLLASGTFRQADRTVLGQWPLHRDFLEAVIGGNVTGDRK